MGGRKERERREREGGGSNQTKESKAPMSTNKNGTGGGKPGKKQKNGGSGGRGPTTAALRDMSRVKGYNPIKQHRGLKYRPQKNANGQYVEFSRPVPDGFTTKPIVSYTTNVNDHKPHSEMPWAHSLKLRTKTTDFDEFSVEILKFAR